MRRRRRRKDGAGGKRTKIIKDLESRSNKDEKQARVEEEERWLSSFRCSLQQQQPVSHSQSVASWDQDHGEAHIAG